ncbi:MAG: multiheme c-type cytochrome [Polyangiales bacterium]
MVWLWVGTLLCTAACGEREPRPAPAVAKLARPALRLVALTDVAGYLEPCGCQSKPLGGIDRAAAKLRELRADRVPVLFVAAGDLLFGPRPEAASSDAEAATQETWKAETLVEIWNRLGLAAATPGKRDLQFGEPVLAQVMARSTSQWLPSKPSEVPVTGWLTKAGEIPVGIVGVSTFEGPEAAIDGQRLRSLGARAQAELDRLRTAGARVTVALISSDQRTGRRLSASLHGLDFAIQGGLDEEHAAAPSRVGGGMLLRAGRQGQGLLVVDIYLGGESPFVDVSEWTRRENKAALQARIGDLAQRVDAWEHDAKVDRASVDEQRRKLQTLHAELARADSAPAASGNAFSARYEPLTSDMTGDPQIGGVVDAYDARVNEHNRIAFADVRPVPAPEGAPHYVGSAACQTCHAPAYSWWTQHQHGRAYTTLERVHKQFNLSCAGCHVTGYGKPGGATLVHNEGLIHVGCESCHGPGSQHALSPSVSSHKLTASPGEAICKQCHTPEHSDLFEYESYVARLRAKGHGAR